MQYKMQSRNLNTAQEFLIHTKKNVAIVLLSRGSVIRYLKYVHQVYIKSICAVTVYIFFLSMLVDFNCSKIGL
jgi:hypothetical protein